MTEELRHAERCTCVIDGVRCSMGRASRSTDSRCEGCAMGLHKGHRDSPARDGHSHIKQDGYAKRSFPTHDEAAFAADHQWATDGNQRSVYKCDQQPDHWHIGRGIPDLIETKGAKKR